MQICNIHSPLFTFSARFMPLGCRHTNLLADAVSSPFFGNDNDGRESIIDYLPLSVQAKSELPDHNSEAHTVDAGKGSAASTAAAASTGETANATEPVWRPPCDENDANRLSLDVNFNYYQPLNLAALKGDWEYAKKFFERDPMALTAKISVLSMTALHVAVSKGQTEFVEKLVELMPSEALAIHDCGCYTPLHYAAMSGNLRIAKALVRKNPALPQITDNRGYNPLLTATFVATEHKELVWFLAKVTTDAPPSCPFTGKWAGRLICYLTHAGFHDISLFLLQRYPFLASTKEQDGYTLLQVLALEPSNFPSGSRLSFWERWIYQIVPVEFITTLQDPVKRDIEHPLQDSGNYSEVPNSMQSRTYMTQVLQRLKMLFWEVIAKFAPAIKRIQSAKLRHKYALELVHFVCKEVSKMSNKERLVYFSSHGILAVATISGVVEIVAICLQYFPEILWLPIENKTIMQFAIAQRQEKIFNLLFERNAINKQQAYSASESKENILILAAKLPPYPQLSSISGPALQMQREMQWFKTVESFIHPAFKELRSEGKTAWHLFQDQHEKLLKEGQKWMKDTSNSCMVVSTLIATVVFAAAFTVPGGNIQDKGIPIFLKQNSFKVFAVSDALSLFSSITSIFMFLSILTSRYAEEDFLEALPKRLIIGLASLFIAIAAMMVAFSATLSLVLGSRWEWVHIPTILLATFPVALFAMLQLPLFFRMVKSTYGPSIFRPQSPW